MFVHFATTPPHLLPALLRVLHEGAQAHPHPPPQRDLLLPLLASKYTLLRLAFWRTRKRRQRPTEPKTEATRPPTDSLPPPPSPRGGYTPRARAAPTLRALRAPRPQSCRAAACLPARAAARTGPRLMQPPAPSRPPNLPTPALRLKSCAPLTEPTAAALLLCAPARHPRPAQPQRTRALLLLPTGSTATKGLLKTRPGAPPNGQTTNVA
jgi:hypothetical protein